MGISSAIPDALTAYCRSALELDEAVLRRSRLVGQALAELRVSRSYGLRDVSPLDLDLRTFAVEASALSTFVGLVGDAFRRADDTAGHETSRVVRASGGRIARLLDEFDPLSRLITGGPDQWDRVVGRRFVCRSPWDRGYRGGGFIIGPDGERYPLVVPHLARDGTVFTGDGATLEPVVDVLGGADRGWETIALVQGVGHDRSAEPSVLESVVATAGYVLGGPDPHVWRAAPGDVYGALSVGPTGVPALSLGKQATPRRDPPPPVPEPIYSAPAPLRSGALAGAASLIPGAAAGTDHLRSRHDQGRFRYQVAFQKHPDGRRRAIFRTYTIEEHRSTGQYRVKPSITYLGPDGEPAHERLTFLDQQPVVEETDPGWELFQEPEKVRP